MDGKVKLVPPVVMLSGQIPETVNRVMAALFVQVMQARYGAPDFPVGHSKHRGCTSSLKIIVGER